ncbi:MAG: hydrogenase maturation nickel metallochaperone HypA [Alphaproteobacteria bacterium]|nr:hydrogenase maturation nickel metallochaperone HypA [Alphaproteobacteria bacterium]
MHESVLAKQLVNAVVERVPPGSRVTRVRGWLAETEALDAGSIELHFGRLAAGTPAEGAALDLELVHVRARCEACGHVYLPEHHVTVCPACESLDATLLDRTGLGIDALDVAG